MKGYGQYCPIARTLDLLGDKWTLLIVRELLRGKRRFRDIEAGLKGIPPNLLSDRLKALEHAGIVTREYFRELPPRVEYSLTERGRSLDSVLESIAGWGMSNLMDEAFPCERVDLDLLFFHLPRFFCAERAGHLSANIEIRLEGEDGGAWWVTVEDGHCEVHAEGEAPAATIICPVTRFVELMATHRDPRRLIDAPEVRIEGDRELARQVINLFCRTTEPAASELLGARA